MTSDTDAVTELPPRLRRAIEIVYAVEGVTSARIWVWPGRVAVGVCGSSAVTSADLLRRIELAVAPLREPDETWEFGLLDEA